MIDATGGPTLEVYRAETGVRDAQLEEFNRWAQAQFGAPGVRVRAGERLVLRDETKLVYTVFWKRPVQSGGVAVIPSGEVLTVALTPSESEVQFLAVPDRYQSVEALVVPAADRRRRGYNGFALRVCLRDLDQVAERLDEGAADSALSAVLAECEAPWLRSAARRRKSGRG